MTKHATWITHVARTSYSAFTLNFADFQNKRHTLSRTQHRLACAPYAISRSLKVPSSSLKFKFEKGVYSILPLQLTTPTMLPSGEADYFRYCNRYIVLISSFLFLSFVVTELKIILKLFLLAHILPLQLALVMFQE